MKDVVKEHVKKVYISTNEHLTEILTKIEVYETKKKVCKNNNI